MIEPFFDLQLSIPLPDQQVCKIHSYVSVIPVRICTSKIRGQSPAVVVPQKVDSTSFSEKKTYYKSTLSDNSDIKSELSIEQNYTDTSHSPYKDVMSSPSIKAYSEERFLSPFVVDPNSFASLQEYLKRCNMEYSSIDIANLSAKNDLEKSLKEFISIDVLNEENKFQCDTCRAKAQGKISVLLTYVLHPNAVKVTMKEVWLVNRC